MLNLYQEDFNKNKEVLINEYKNNSLFAKEKTIIINQTNENLLIDLKYLFENKQSTKIILFADLLEKNQKLDHFSKKKKI